MDVAIVGAGYTGLWTAYYLAAADPSLRIAVLEAEYAGFGASGRNGGWCSGLFPISVSALARRYGRDRAVAQYRAHADTVDEVGRVAAAEGIDCHYVKGGSVTLARSPAQLARARAATAEPGFDRSPRVFAALRRTLRDLFDADLPIEHSWGGPLGIPRDWMPSVGLRDGAGWAGGYVGDGVAAANLAGRTLSHLILGVDSDLVRLPWVSHRSRRWEPEPVRWLGINTVLRWTRFLGDHEGSGGYSTPDPS